MASKKKGKKKKPKAQDGGVSLLDVKEMLVNKFRDNILEFELRDKGKTKVFEFSVPREQVVPVSKFLQEKGFEHCSLITAVDWKDRFEVLYHIASYRYGLLLQMSATLPHDDPTVDTVSKIWGGADWNEREAWDLMGIVFTGHPNLERILLPHDFKGHPLRKDYKEVG
jgi:NADH-quinone oxidoreductase subunit C